MIDIMCRMYFKVLFMENEVLTGFNYLRTRSLGFIFISPASLIIRSPGRYSVNVCWLSEKMGVILIGRNPNALTIKRLLHCIVTWSMSLGLSLISCS